VPGLISRERLEADLRHVADAGDQVEDDANSCLIPAEDAKITASVERARRSDRVRTSFDPTRREGPP
jgi:hypothetical protein